VVRDVRDDDQPRDTSMKLAFALALVIGASSANAQTRLYYEQTYMPAAHNWAFRAGISGSRPIVQCVRLRSRNSL
jgi:hypothetical protein